MTLEKVFKKTRGQVFLQTTVAVVVDVTVDVAVFVVFAAIQQHKTFM